MYKDSLYKEVSKEQIKEFVEAEFARWNDVPKQLKITKKLIDKISNHYFCKAGYEFYYDIEPSFDDKEFDMYCDYYHKSWQDVDGDMIMGEYTKEYHSMEEYRTAYENVVKGYSDYEPKRLAFHNWVEVIENGNWGWTQKSTDDYAKRTLRSTLKASYNKKGRFYYSEDKQVGKITVYICLRDIEGIDYCFDFYKKTRQTFREIWSVYSDIEDSDNLDYIRDLYFFRTKKEAIAYYDMEKNKGIHKLNRSCDRLEIQMMCFHEAQDTFYTWLDSDSLLNSLISGEKNMVHIHLQGEER